MREYISVDSEANRIRMRRNNFSGTFLLVEGRTDKIFYQRFIDTLTCELVCVSGKPSSKKRVIDVLDILEKASFQGILAIVDADFDRLAVSYHQSPNLLRTDTHDVETMLFQSYALDKVIAEFGSEQKLAKFGDVRAALLQAGVCIGYLRWVSQCDGLNLTFEGITFSKFIDKTTVIVDDLKMIQEVKNKSKKLSFDSEELQKKITSRKSSSHDPWQVCCGHDLVAILSFGLRKAIGSARDGDVKTELLEQILRLSYEEAYFITTQLYLDIRSWESNNRAFKVLRNKT